MSVPQYGSSYIMGIQGYVKITVQSKIYICEKDGIPRSCTRAGYDRSRREEMAIWVISESLGALLFELLFVFEDATSKVKYINK